MNRLQQYHCVVSAKVVRSFSEPEILIHHGDILDCLVKDIISGNRLIPLDKICESANNILVRNCG